MKTSDGKPEVEISEPAPRHLPLQKVKGRLWNGYLIYRSSVKGLLVGFLFALLNGGDWRRGVIMGASFALFSMIVDFATAACASFEQSCANRDSGIARLAAAALCRLRLMGRHLWIVWILLVLIGLSAWLSKRLGGL
jgi:hypothetical protein